MKAVKAIYSDFQGFEKFTELFFSSNFTLMTQVTQTLFNIRGCYCT